LHPAGVRCLLPCEGRECGAPFARARKGSGAAGRARTATRRCCPPARNSRSAQKAVERKPEIFLARGGSDGVVQIQELHVHTKFRRYGITQSLDTVALGRVVPGCHERCTCLICQMEVWLGDFTGQIDVDTAVYCGLHHVLGATRTPRYGLDAL